LSAIEIFNEVLLFFFFLRLTDSGSRRLRCKLRCGFWQLNFCGRLETSMTNEQDVLTREHKVWIRVRHYPFVHISIVEREEAKSDPHVPARSSSFPALLTETYEWWQQLR
jgi:hypothetical protein